ncbi:glycopeptide antibiotics resistance protein [Streptomyces aurantiacus]|uniref:VanZ family protein n=1 Tax=Streptomyces aurantiacus TaxID=47760 RepID=UPI002793110B|nr:VanZ family protein [Streptomyces aurantiacus]MDQ0777446.1 glycopeptide antibiotics resistance protein [Streptomyces aurantiacus]
MTDVYLLPIRTASVIFPGLALLMFVPTAVVIYRRHGVMTRWRVLSLYAGVYYALTALCLTIVPLPSPSVDVCAKYPSFADPQFMPGTAFADIWKEAHHRVTFNALVLENSAVWQTVFNVLLLLPLGAFVRIHFRRGPMVATAAGFAGSLFFELTQYTGLWGLYACPYRVFCVDDLIVNTAGAALGWAAAGPLARVLPDLATLDDRALDLHRVPFGRRLLALLLDMTGAALLTGAVGGLVLLGLGTDAVLWVPPAVWVLWFVLVPRWSGATPGKHVLLVKLVTRSGGRPGHGALAVRAAVLGLPFAGVWFIAGATLPAAGADPSTLIEVAGGVGYREVAYALAADPTTGLALLLAPVAGLAVAVWCVRAVRRHPEGLGLHEILSGVRNKALPHATARRGGGLDGPAGTESESGTEKQSLPGADHERALARP